MRLDLSQKFALASLAVAAVGAGLPSLLEAMGVPGWGAFFVAMGMGAWLGWIYSSQLTSNFASLRNCTERISRGDLTAEVDIDAGRRFPDETVDLARSVGAMLQNLRELVEHIQRAADQVANSSRQVSGATQHMGSASGEMFAAMDAVLGDSVRQEEEVAQIAARTHEIASALRRTAELARDGSQLAARVNQRATAGVAVSRVSAARMQGLFGDIDQAGQLVAHFETKIASVNRVTEMIFSVVEKAHLLSLNASIEAARAGEAGRGFSVVAEEIRKLAENAGSSAEQIEQLMGQLQDESHTIAEATRKIGESVSDGRQDIDGIFQAFEQVQDAVESTSGQSEELYRQARDRAADAERMVADVEGVASGVSDNAKRSESIRRQLGDQARLVEELVRNATQLSDMSVELEQVARRFRTR